MSRALDGESSLSVTGIGGGRMRAKVLIKLCMVAVFLAAAIAVVAPSTANASALVDKVTCQIRQSGRVYEGSGVFVISSVGGVVFQCHASLVSGTPVEETTITFVNTFENCVVVERPNGDADQVCRFTL
jgi:hypothetical protein